MLYYEQKKEIALSNLKYAGWYPNRKIDVDMPLLELLEDGIEIFQSGIEFLQEFCFLEISFRCIHVENAFNKIIIDPTCGLGYKKNCEIISKYIKKKLMPIGACNDLFVLLITTDNEIYGCYDKMVKFIGKDVYEAVYNLIFDINLNSFQISEL
jgi:hypothetical protein